MALGPWFSSKEKIGRESLTLVMVTVLDIGEMTSHIKSGFPVAYWVWLLFGVISIGPHAKESIWKTAIGLVHSSTVFVVLSVHPLVSSISSVIL